MGAVRCNMLTGALVPRWGTVAGVPGPRRSADECDAGWFAPVATRRRPFLPSHSPWPEAVLLACRSLPRRLAIPCGPRRVRLPPLLGLAELSDRDSHHGQAHDGDDS